MSRYVLAVLAVAAMYAVATYAAIVAHGANMGAWFWSDLFLSISLVGLLIALLVHVAARRPLASFWAKVPDAAGLHVALLLVLAGFASYKPVMQQVVPFWVDAPLIALDRWLHLGSDPYELIPRWPLLTRVIDELYIPGWFTLLCAVPALWIWAFPPRERARAVMAFVLTWVLLGTVVATILSSAGPAYAERLAVSDSFVPLIEYLRDQPLRANAVREALWSAHIQGVEGGGISAMPSLHVAMATLYTLTFWRWPLARLLCLAYTVLILVGSVHLGWHYAIDGYLAIVGTWMIWWLSGRLVPVEARPHKQPRSEPVVPA